MATKDFLREMETASKARVASGKSTLPERAMRAVASQRSPIDFERSLRSRTGTRIIAETKRKSPSLGSIALELDPANLARRYVAEGAAAISVLTEPQYFAGSLEALQSVRNALPETPLLMKDFLVDPYQLLQARAFGADAVLLIFSLLGPELLGTMLREARSLSLSPLVEIHGEDELQAAVELGATLIGINNRNLRTLQIDLNMSRTLASRKTPGTFLVSESGIAAREQVCELEGIGFDAFLVGTHLVRHPERIRNLRGERP